MRWAGALLIRANVVVVVVVVCTVRVWRFGRRVRLDCVRMQAEATSLYFYDSLMRCGGWKNVWRRRWWLFVHYAVCHVTIVHYMSSL